MSSGAPASSFTLRRRTTASTGSGSHDWATVPRSTIIFRHPAYPDEYQQNILLHLDAFDGEGVGLHHGTALLACGLIACNSWNGYLSESRDGPRIDLGSDELLTASNYWFHLPGMVAATPHEFKHTSHERHYRYAVYPSFDQWSFPHTNPPPGWSNLYGIEAAEGRGLSVLPSASVSNFSNSVIQRDHTCCVSSCRDILESAHLCPRAKLDWFRRNGMQLYNRNRGLQSTNQCDDTSNAVALRADIHKAFNEKIFFITQKHAKWTVHFLAPTYELGAHFHNMELELSTGIAPAFVLTRIAWAIFPQVSGAGFFDGPTKLVKIWTGTDQEVVLFTQEEQRRLFEVGNVELTQSERRREGDTAVEEAVHKRRRLENVEARIACATDTESCLTSTTSASAALTSSDTHDCPDSKSVSNDLSLENSSLAARSSEDIPIKLSQKVLGISQTKLDELEEADAMAAIRAEWCRAQRPSEQHLICCDYDRAQGGDVLGVEGTNELLRSRLCWECLGGERRSPVSP